MLVYTKLPLNILRFNEYKYNLVRLKIYKQFEFVCRYAYRLISSRHRNRFSRHVVIPRARMREDNGIAACLIRKVACNNKFLTSPFKSQEAAVQPVGISFYLQLKSAEVSNNSVFALRKVISLA